MSQLKEKDAALAPEAPRIEYDVIVGSAEATRHEPTKGTISDLHDAIAEIMEQLAATRGDVKKKR